MYQVVYLPGQNVTIEKFVVISELDALLDFIKFNRVSLLSIPVHEDFYDILDTIINNELNIKTIHIQQSNNNLVLRLKLFFEIAKAYSEHGIKNDVILKHEYLDNTLTKINKKD